MSGGLKRQLEGRIVILALTIFVLGLIAYTIIPVASGVDVPFPPNALLILFAVVLLLLYFFWLKVEVALVAGALLLAISLGSFLAKQENVREFLNPYIDRPDEEMVWLIIPLVVGLAFFVVHLIKIRDQDKIISPIDQEDWALLPAVVIVFGSIFLFVESAITEWAQQGAVLTGVIIVIDTILIFREMRSIRETVMSEKSKDAASKSKS